MIVNKYNNESGYTIAELLFVIVFSIAIVGSVTGLGLCFYVGSHFIVKYW